VKPVSAMRWFSVGTPFLVGSIIILDLVLHYAKQVAWPILVLPSFAVGVIQIAMFAAMYLARKRESHRMAAGISGIYCLVVGMVVIHYGTSWGLLIGFGRLNIWPFAITVILSTIALMFLIKPSRKGPSP